ncbi:hypothetical protein GMC23_12045 [Turicibacter sanguinis]|nr:hypothetical protein [Turicibacter sanguinis]MTO27668.1 hypothetical protein [Turicibacter sanguinis]MTO90609.1 hypothetical protein [Turicibacter sanguinis]MTP70728.1 hypothetical protein [Turicibacter sanguinis]MTQ02900.1 hypothetical protein [Turicibacter sanguinis]
MLKSKKLPEYNTLLKSLFVLNKEIEENSFIILSFKLTNQSKAELIRELDYKTQQYVKLVALSLTKINNYNF